MNKNKPEKVFSCKHCGYVRYKRKDINWELFENTIEKLREHQNDLLKLWSALTPEYGNDMKTLRKALIGAVNILENGAILRREEEGE